MRAFFPLLISACLSSSPIAAELSAVPFDHGDATSLEGAIPANERGIVSLAVAGDGRVYFGTTGRAAHLGLYDSNSGQAASLARLEGGVGLSFALVLLPDGSLIAGTQSDPTGIAVTTDADKVGRLYRFVPGSNGKVKVEDLGVAVEGEGIYTIAYVAASGEIVGNTWPEGHFFSYDLKEKTFHDHGAIAGYRTYETPRYAEKINQGTDRNLSYSRVVSRCVVVDPQSGAYTGGAEGVIYHYDPASKKLDKLKLSLPCVRGREPWASLDAAIVLRSPDQDQGSAVIGGTSDGFLFELKIAGSGDAKQAAHEISNWGKPSAQPGVQGLAGRIVEAADGRKLRVIDGVTGTAVGMPRAFRLVQGPATFSLTTGGIPAVDGRASMEGFGAIAADNSGHIYAGEIDRIATLVRYGLEPREKPKPARRAAPATPGSPADFNRLLASAGKLPCRIVFAPDGTTTEASGYTGIEVGRDGNVYVGSARYGDYAWLLRFPGFSLLGKEGQPSEMPTFMEKVAGMRDLSGEQGREGINTQGKIHAKIVVGADGKVWFATKQAHESFAARPEYGEDPLGFAGGHLCFYDPATGFSRSLGILKHQEGLMAGAIDDARQKIYYRSEPKNHFLIYDLKTGELRDAGNVGAQCRYMAMDERGAVYTIGRDATICRYDPDTGYVEDLAIEIDGEGTYKEPYVIAIGPNGKLYGAVGGHPSIMEFDVDQVPAGGSAAHPKVAMRNVAPASPDGLPVIDIHAGVFGLDGRFYFPLNTSDWSKLNDRSARKLFIMRFDPQTKKTELVGLPDIQGFNEEEVKHVYIREAVYGLDHMQGAAVGPDGSLYLMDIYPQLNIACFPGLTKP